ncbi:MAG TPA: hypothetical protein VJG65_02215 [Patescibacteria group bacterium]|nr:hypothetical protein [Patescibacteria group bacterium]
MNWPIFRRKDDFSTKLLNSIFRFSFILFVVLFLVDLILPGFVTNYFNPIWLLILAIISGIIIVYD